MINAKLSMFGLYIGSMLAIHKEFFKAFAVPSFCHFRRAVLGREETGKISCLHTLQKALDASVRAAMHWRLEKRLYLSCRRQNVRFAIDCIDSVTWSLSESR